MGQALSIAGRALALWWKEFPLLTLFNVAWFALQFPVVTAPLATAAMYVMAWRVSNGETLDPRQGWQALRELAGPAWKWAAVNLVIGVPLVWNFWAFQGAEGVGWIVLRLVWGGLAVLLFAVDLFYWPFYLHQEDRRLVNTLRNSLLILFRAPGLSLTLVVLSGGLIAVSILLTLPLAAALMAWVALMGVLAVQEELGQRK